MQRIQLHDAMNIQASLTKNLVTDTNPQHINRDFNPDVDIASIWFIIWVRYAVPICHTAARLFQEQCNYEIRNIERTFI